MAARFLSLHRLRRALPLARPPLFSSSPKPSPPSPIPPLRFLPTPTPLSPSRGHRSFSHGTVDLILSEGKPPRFETHGLEPPKKDKWRSKKRLKMQRKRAKRKRRDANKKDPRRIRPKGKKTKHKFPDAEARIKYKIEKARIKEAMLVEKLERYEVPKVQGPMVKPENLTGEERFYMKKMAQKRSNYVPVGRRGVFGGVILNMHLHWKKHETVKVVCKPCKPGQVHEYARDIARLSGGVPIQIIGNDTIIFYRGKNYVQPEVMSPIDTLSKKKALEKSKYEQSLETVRRFIAISEKELELYYRHIALYGDPSSRNSDLVYGDSSKAACKLETKTSDLMEEKNGISSCDDICSGLSDMEVESGDDELTGTDVDAYDELESEDDSEGEELYESNYSQDKENKSTLPTHQFETFVHHQ